MNRHFKLGTTSFIFPEHIIPNIKKLGAFVDEIELLIFESRPWEVIPSRADVGLMATLAEDLNLTYNVHLPTDINLASPTRRERRKAADVLLRVMERFEPLNPSTYTLHFEMPREVRLHSGTLEHLSAWVEMARQGIRDLLAHGIRPVSISVENLDYPFSIIEPLIEAFGLSVCMDAGHLLRYGYDPLEFYSAHAREISVIHLHGVKSSEGDRKDHRPLDVLSRNDFKRIRPVLETYRGVVSLEVFSLEHLNRSLGFLALFFTDIPVSVRRDSDPVRKLTYGDLE